MTREEQLKKLDAMAKPRSDESIRKAEERKKQREDQDLLLRDLCARLPYGLKVHYKTAGWDDKYCAISPQVIDNMLHRSDVIVKPYLRPMLSMTEDELQRYHELCDVDEAVGVGSSIEIIAVHDTPKSLDYLNSIHVDYRGLIPKGLAISTEEFNPYK